MNEAQEQELIKVLLKVRAEGKRLLYRDVGVYECLKQIISIGNGPPPSKWDVPEPSLCAYFEDGQYVALYNCGMSDFGIFEQLK